MATTSKVRTWWADYWAKGYDRRVTFLGREGAKMTDFTLPAWRALEAALVANGYGNASIVSTYYPRPIGGYNCNMETGGYGCSLHGYSGCAMDIDPSANPFVKGTRWDFSRTKFTREQVDAVLAIRTNSGAQAFRWGGDFGDYMHWQINCTPSDIASGIDPKTVPEGGAQPPIQEDDDMAIAKGHPVEATVIKVQECLVGWNAKALPQWGADGDYGNETAEWVGIFQTEHGLPSTGVVDNETAWLLDDYIVSGGTGVPGPQGPEGPEGPAGKDGTVEVFVNGDKVA